jgi:uncharacterized protein YbaP (TraB family)
MKKTILILVLTTFLAIPVLSETSVWIAKTDSSVMYIGGTIHLLRQSDRPFPPEFDRAYEASEVLVFETDYAKLKAPETQQAIMAKAFYSDGRTLDSVLSDSVYRILEAYCAENEIPLASMNNLKPSIAMITLAGLELKKLGVDQEGIDAYYHGKATADEKKTAGLESVAEQIEMLTSLADGSEDAFILYSIEDLKKTGEVFDQIVKAWKTGDEAALNDLFITELKPKFPKVFELIFVDRNMKWVPRIEEYLISPETEFVLVGTGHLVGKEGVITQLKKLGYEVEKFK